MLKVRSYLDVGNTSAHIHVKKKCGPKNVLTDGKCSHKNIQDGNDKCFEKNVQTDGKCGSKNAQVDDKCGTKNVQSDDKHGPKNIQDENDESACKNVQADDKRRSKNQTDSKNVDDVDEPNTQLSDGTDSEKKNESVLISI